MQKTVKVEKKIEIGKLYHLPLLHKIGYTLIMMVAGPPIMFVFFFFISFLMAVLPLLMILICPVALVWTVYQEVWVPPQSDDKDPLEGLAWDAPGMEAPGRPGPDE